MMRGPTMKFTYVFILFALTVQSHDACANSYLDPVLHDAQMNVSSCLNRFQNHIQANHDEIQKNYLQTLKSVKNFETTLDHQFVGVTWAEKIYDYFAANKWDREHPMIEKTTVGKLRANRSRAKFLAEKLYQLSELEKMQPKISDRIDALFTRMSSHQKSPAHEWVSARNALRDHEQTYYDFIGEQTRTLVYEQGYANGVDWNKTMGKVQENFFRVLSCVTLLDQMKVLIPKSLLEGGKNELAESASREITRKVSSEVSVEDLE